MFLIIGENIADKFFTLLLRSDNRIDFSRDFYFQYMIACGTRLEIYPVSRSLTNKFRLFERHIFRTGRHHTVPVFLRIGKSFFNFVVIAFCFRERLYVTHQAKIVRDILSAFFAQYLVKETFFCLDANFCPSRVPWKCCRD